MEKREEHQEHLEHLELYLPVGKTYNLTVDVGHTFYVGELKTWVHNEGPCDLPVGYLGASATSSGLSSGEATDTGFDGPKNASSEIDPQKLELLTSHPDAHSFSVHGGSVTDGDLMVRAKSGIKPNGATGPSVPPLSSAFHSDDLLVQADQFVRDNALQSAIARNPGSNTVRVTVDDVGDVGIYLGRGFKRVWSNGNAAKNLEVLGAPAKVDNLRGVEVSITLIPREISRKPLLYFKCLWKSRGRVMYDNIRYMLSAVFSADFGFQEEAAINIYLGGLRSSGKLDEMKAELVAAFKDKDVCWKSMLLNEEYEVQDFDTEEESMAYIRRVLWDPLVS